MAKKFKLLEERWGGINPPATRYSKRKCVKALKAAGVWPQVESWINANGLHDDYITAQDFADDDPDFMRGLSALKDALGWSDEQVQSVLSACIAEG